jgi:transmembrane sensor
MEPLLKSDSRQEEPSAAVVDQAAEWLAHIESGDASEQDHCDLDAWRRAAPAHALALERMDGLRDRLGGAPPVEQETLRRLLSRPKKRARGGAILALAVLIGGAWMTARLPAVELHFADVRTQPGETRVVDLADGSKLTLSSDSAANIDVGSARRTVKLLRGEILAQVAKQDGAAFTAKSGDGAVVALGTAFTVRKDGGSTVVAVAESRVLACPARRVETACATLLPGQRARLTPGALERLADEPAANIGAWAEGWLAADDRPLVEVLNELNRWRAEPISFDARALSDLRVSGVFSLREPDKAVANLSQLLPISIDRSDPAAPVVRRR